MRKKEQIKHWNKIFKLGDKINKKLKLTETEIVNLIAGTITGSSTKWTNL